MVWTEEKLGPIIHSILNPDEEVLSLYQSKTTKSIYGCILWNNYYYKVFRVSNHPSQSTYKQPTFYDFHGEFYMKGAIRTYLYHTNSWYELSKQSYYLLLFFQKLWDEKQEVEASWQNGRIQIRLVVEEEGGKSFTVFQIIRQGRLNAYWPQACWWPFAPPEILSRYGRAVLLHRI
ncbi:hypothetical protein [Streptococcus suis]|uniref:hypothetical protein n=1 Tax=Streptococcus suis TaxID=1307 RepID=UPI000AEDDA00|nr:hypothetical protein [Streptococcus suis]